MCVILVGKVKDLVKLDLESAWQSNPHGAGIIIPGAEPTAIKGLMALGQLKDALTALESVKPKRRICVHLRWATHGTVNEQNTHPFYVAKDAFLMHNGVISQLGSSGTGPNSYSDSAHLAKILSCLEHSDRHAVLKIVSGKFAYVKGREINTFGYFENRNGVMMSNSSWMSPRVRYSSGCYSGNYVGRYDADGCSEFGFCEGESWPPSRVVVGPRRSMDGQAGNFRSIDSQGGSIVKLHGKPIRLTRKQVDATLDAQRDKHFERLKEYKREISTVIAGTKVPVTALFTEEEIDAMTLPELREALNTRRKEVINSGEAAAIVQGVVEQNPTPEDEWKAGISAMEARAQQRILTARFKKDFWGRLTEPEKECLRSLNTFPGSTDWDSLDIADLMGFDAKIDQLIADMLAEQVEKAAEKPRVKLLDSNLETQAEE